MDSRNKLTSPPLRQPGAWMPPPPAASGMDFAERLGLWLGPFDAIGLHAAHQAIRGMQAPDARASARSRLSPAEDLRRLREVLATAVGRAMPQDPSDAGAWHALHLDLQRRMEMAIPPLRSHVRDVLAHASLRLRQLAALDAALERVLARREQALLPGLPALLKRRFEQLQRAGADAWLETFGREWRQALHEELELRLAPVAGLAAAFDNEPDNPR